MKRIIFIAALISIAMVSCAKPQLVTEYQLPNGLKVVIISVPKAELVSLITLYSVGENADPRGKSGMAHLIEHLYVTAAAGESPATTAERYMADHPKGWNAQTGMDYTVIATVFPKARLDAELGMAAARMKKLDITKIDLDREIPRIKLELTNMYDRNPLLACQNISQQMLLGLPPDGRKGGVIEQIQAMTVDELSVRSGTLYKPANARIIVCGPVDPGKIRPRIEALFSKIDPGKTNTAKSVVPLLGRALLQVGEITPLFKNSEPHVALSYRAPAPSDRSFPAFLVLVRRLMTNLEKLNLSPSTFLVYFAPLDKPEVVSLVLPAENQETPEALLERLKNYVAEMMARTPDNEELKSAREYFNFAYCRETYRLEALARDPYGVAFSLGRTRQLGIDGEALMRKIEETTQSDLKVAGDYFTPGKSSAAIVKIKN